MQAGSLVTLVTLALSASLGTGLAQAQGADVHWSVIIGASAGAPVYSQSVLVHLQQAPIYLPAAVPVPQGY